MSIEEIILKVAAIPDASLKKLEAISTEVDYPKGHLLFDTNKINSNIYFIAKGIVRAYLHYEHHEVTFWFGKESDPVLSIQTYVYDNYGYENIELLEDCKFYLIKKKELEQLYSEDIFLANWGRRLADISFADTEKRLISRQFKSTYERYNEFVAQFPDLLQRVQLKIIASYLGMTAVTLSRIRAKR